MPRGPTAQAACPTWAVGVLDPATGAGARRRDPTSLHGTYAAWGRAGIRQVGGRTHSVGAASPVLPVKTSHSTSLSRATSFSFLQNFLCSGQLARWHATPQ